MPEHEKDLTKEDFPAEWRHIVAHLPDGARVRIVEEIEPGDGIFDIEEMTRPDLEAYTRFLQGEVRRGYDVPPAAPPTGGEQTMDNLRLRIDGKLVHFNVVPPGSGRRWHIVRCDYSEHGIPRPRVESRHDTREEVDARLREIARTAEPTIPPTGGE